MSCQLPQLASFQDIKGVKKLLFPKDGKDEENDNPSVLNPSEGKSLTHQKHRSNRRSKSRICCSRFNLPKMGQDRSEDNLHRQRFKKLCTSSFKSKVIAHWI